MGCDGLPPDRQEGVMEEVPGGIEFEMPVTMTDGAPGGGGGVITTPGFTVPAVVYPSFSCSDEGNANNSL